MASNLLLIHSPLVGPSVWDPARRLLEADGRRVATPDLRAALDAPAGERGAAFVAAAAESAIGDSVTIVGFSGAGVHLPAIAERLAGRVETTCFVDAVVPPADGLHELSRPFADFIDAKTTNGMLQPWIDWWPDEVARMVPDEELRRTIAADMPRVPRAFYDEQVKVPDDWSHSSARYLQLSAAYDADRHRAVSFGWPTAGIEGTHLSVATDPAAVVEALDELLR